jgi:hypothetical protein
LRPELRKTRKAIPAEVRAVLRPELRSSKEAIPAKMFSGLAGITSNEGSFSLQYRP